MGKLKRLLTKTSKTLSKQTIKKVVGIDDAKIKDAKKRLAPVDLSVIPVRNRTLALYKQDDSVLFVGEGNFSFSRAICEAIGPQTVISTCYDSEEVVSEKYTESADNISAILELDGSVLYGIDATNLTKHRPLKAKKFSKIVFNFPHCGKGPQNCIKDQDRNIRSNQELCSGFLQSSQALLAPGGEILLTLRSGEPYDSWDVKRLAKTVGLATKTTTVFHPDDFPGYAHRRTIGFDEKVSTDDNEDILRSRCQTYVFVTKNIAEKIFAKKKKADDDGDSGDEQ
ncbi:hypothetical protein HDU97_008961 [Phlyctochytrium planicorne]|nr:hypothetical protein HDU97_008961 [Phlyctochytrium planicorne]